ncbi:MAG: formate/nitrite transporter family protein [Lachnospiraceae bacterium]|nr:formate/nitrite transporter family protein [Lachnospiraceae bacterium]
MHSPLEIAKNYVDIGIHKTMMSAFKMTLLGFFAGLFISFAGIAATTATATMETASAGRLIAAIVFPAGMAMVLIAGSELFTGNNLIIISVLEKKVSVFKMLKNWFFVYTGNFIGALFVSIMVTYGHVPDLFGGTLAEAVINSGVIRTSMDFQDALIRGILCNVLVCIAVWMAFASKDVSGKLLISFWPVMLFVLCGFEHCIADMYFCMAALFTSVEYGIPADTLTWSNFITHNLIPVTLGNLIGGVGVGAGYWLAYLSKTPFINSDHEQEDIEIAEEY